jgi:hypothetical protein
MSFGPYFDGSQEWASEAAHAEWHGEPSRRTFNGGPTTEAPAWVHPPCPACAQPMPDKAVLWPSAKSYHFCACGWRDPALIANDTPGQSQPASAHFTESDHEQR